MINATDIAHQLDQILDTGMDDSIWRIQLSARVQGYGPRATDVDELDAHEIYERALGQAAVETALIRHGEYQDERGRIVVREINGLTFDL